MKNTYIKDILKAKPPQNIELYCFVKSIRFHSNQLFIDFTDSSGQIQGVLFDKERINQHKNLSVESCVKVTGTTVENKNIEIQITDIEVINPSTINLSPSPRSNFNVFDARYTDLVHSKKHLYLRNPQLIAIQQFRNCLLHYVREWFFDNNFIEIAAPVITPLTLYEKSSAIPVSLNGQDLFLSQCAGYYLEAACVAFEKVYNISPSFRGEEGRSKRHLLEYWHIKAEIAFANFEDIINIVENFLENLTTKLKENKDLLEILATNGLSLTEDALDIPFKRITYSEAILLLQQNNYDIPFGKSISTQHEEVLSKLLGGTFWLVNMPRSIEPFPYRIDENNADMTMVADLIASEGFGEILGTAEKIFDSKELADRMIEKQKYDDPQYDWIKEVHDSGCPPHVAFGIGVERLIRWLIKINHVRDAHPFPRVFGRKVTI